MKINFCSYFDKNYLSKFLNLKSSLDRFNFEYTFYVLALDNYVVKFFKENNFDNLKIIQLDEIENNYKLLKIAKKIEILLNIILHYLHFYHYIFLKMKILIRLPIQILIFIFLKVRKKEFKKQQTVVYHLFGKMLMTDMVNTMQDG